MQKETIESQKTEDALRESKEHFPSPFERSHAIMHLIDPESGAIIDASEAAAKFYGYSRTELRAMNISEINQLPPEEIAAARRSILEGETKHFVFPHRLRSGEIRMVDVYSSPFEMKGRTVLFSIVHDITERKLAEQELRQTRDYLENIFANSPDGIGIVDRTGKFIRWNRMAAEQYGYSFDELRGKSAFDMYADKKELNRMLAELRRIGAVRKYAIKMIKNGGTVAPFEISINLLKDSTNRIIGSVCVARDLSDMAKALKALETSHKRLRREVQERKNAQEALKQSRQQLMDIIDFLPDATFVVNNEGRVIAWNKAAEQMTSVKARDMIGRGDYEYAVPFYGERRPILVDLVLKPREEIEAKYLNVKRGDTVLMGESFAPALPQKGACVVGTASILRDSSGNIVGAIESIRDITEARKVQDELSRTNVEMAQLLASIPSYLIGLTPQHRIIRWNGAAVNIFGISEQTALGKPISQCGIQWDQHRIAEAISLCQKNGASLRVDDIRFQKPDGKEGFLSFIVNFIEGEGNVPQSILLLGNDITQRKILENQLVQAQKLESIGQLAAGIAHEINTPTQYVGDNTRFLDESFGSLRRIHLLYDQLLDRLKAGGPTDELVKRIEETRERVDFDYIREDIPNAIKQSLEGIERISKIVQSMKEFSHPGTDEKTAVDINKAIENTITVARNEWKYVAEVSTDFDPNLPPVSCLPGEFNQVILNMIINSAHAIAEKLDNGTEQKGEIRISTGREDGFVHIRIGDNGCGIKEDIRGKVFDPFFTTKEVGKGTGQGLAISHSVIVKKHGGTIGFESVAGKGTTFVIKLPL